MKVAVLEAVGSLDNIRIVERPEPKPGPGEVLVRMRAASLNFRDLVVVEGGYGARQKKQDLDQQIESLSTELAQLQIERGHWQRRIALLKPRGVDPDMLDERARALLDYAHPNDLTLMIEPPRSGGGGGS